MDFICIYLSVETSRPEQVEDNARAAGVKLTPDAVQEIDDILEGVVQHQ